MKMKHLITVSIIAAVVFKGNYAHAQGMAVNATGATANSSAMLDVASTTQGMLVPRMTSAQRTAISTPATGLLVYQTDGTAGFYFYNSSAWTSLSGGGSNVAYTYTSQSSSTTAVAGTAYIAATDGITFTLPSSPATGATIRIVVPHTFTSVGINFGSKGGFGAVSFNTFSAGATKIVGTDLEYAQTFVYDGSTWLQTPQF